MYIAITIQANGWSIQQHQEDGTTIGSAAVYDDTDYQLQRNTELQSYVIQLASREDKAWPVVAAYPYCRTIILPEP